MATEYKDYQRDLGPPWLQGRYGAAWAEAHGLAKDYTLDAAKQAVRARFVASAPADGLPYIGRDRLLPRYPGDTDATYRARLAAAPAIWQQAGSRAGILTILGAIGFTAAAVYHARDATPPGESAWPPDGDTANWSRFWVFLDCTGDPATGNPFAWASVAWGTRRWGDGWTWGSTATRAEVSLVRRAIRLMKPLHAVCAGIYVDLAGGRRLRGRGME